MCWFVVGLFSLTREMNASIESVCRPVPLYFPVCFMVLQMSPGRWSVWLLVVWDVRSVGSHEQGVGYNFLTVGKLFDVMIAILLNIAARAMAVR